jgi:hypothetical protein
MKIGIFGLLAGWLLVTTLASAEPGIQQEQIRFAKGESSATLKGKIKGDQTVDYQLRAQAGQPLTVKFKPDNLSAYFNVLPPGSDVAIFVGSTSGNRYEDQLPSDGVYTLRVYQMRNAARRNETAAYTLEVKVADGDKATEASPRPPTTTSTAFDRTLSLQGSGSINTLHIVPSGLAIDNSPIEREIDGTVTGAEIADLNADGSPEIYVYITSAGSGSYGSLVAYSVNRGKSLSEIHLPPITDDKKLARGYRGHDEFAVGEGRLLHRWPIYRETDTNAKPTGGTRQLQHKLVPGEAGWSLKIDRVVEY